MTTAPTTPARQAPSLMSSLKAVPFNPFAQKDDEPSNGVGRAFGPGGEWRGFRQYSPGDAMRLFQTADVVPHPGHAVRPPQKPDLLLRLRNPHTAAAARAEVDRRGVPGLLDPRV